MRWRKGRRRSCHELESAFFLPISAPPSIQNTVGMLTFLHFGPSQYPRHLLRGSTHPCCWTSRRSYRDLKDRSVSSSSPPLPSPSLTFPPLSLTLRLGFGSGSLRYLWIGCSLPRACLHWRLCAERADGAGTRVSLQRRRWELVRQNEEIAIVSLRSRNLLSCLVLHLPLLTSISFASQVFRSYRSSRIRRQDSQDRRPSRFGAWSKL